MNIQNLIVGFADNLIEIIERTAPERIVRKPENREEIACVFLGDTLPTDISLTLFPRNINNDVNAHNVDDPPASADFDLNSYADPMVYPQWYLISCRRQRLSAKHSANEE